MQEKARIHNITPIIKQIYWNFFVSGVNNAMIINNVATPNNIKNIIYLLSLIYIFFIQVIYRCIYLNQSEFIKISEIRKGITKDRKL